MLSRLLVVALLVGPWLVPLVAVASDNAREMAPGHTRERHPARVREAAASTAEHTDKVNINTADVKELMTLHGVHHKAAEKIVEYRDAHGAFKKPEDIKKVDGVGHGLWERNHDRIVVK
ncbi:MAG: ComEA family DNA-binding protein [Candidatus Rokubacteria bacterium]|nr:ComEA family DNA-binding protein [Candidatus Rokubacteria bacterium]